jgi:hypothetical protein
MKEYPAFIIDRSRRSAASRYADDFVVCTDKGVGFIARVYKVAKSRRNEFAEVWQSSPERYEVKALGEAVVVLELVRFFYEPVAHVNRVAPLMKKALKAYLYGEQKEVEGDGSAYDKQIAAVEDVVRIAESQREYLIDMNGKSATDLFINSLTAAGDSLRLLKKLVRNE